LRLSIPVAGSSLWSRVRGVNLRGQINRQINFRHPISQPWAPAPVTVQTLPNPPHLRWISVRHNNLSAIVTESPIPPTACDTLIRNEVIAAVHWRVGNPGKASNYTTIGDEGKSLCRRMGDTIKHHDRTVNSLCASIDAAEREKRSEQGG
jgi:hypothetical protein